VRALVLVLALLAPASAFAQGVRLNNPPDRIGLVDGTTTGPSAYFLLDLDTGIWRDAATNTLVIQGGMTATGGADTGIRLTNVADLASGDFALKIQDNGTTDLVTVAGDGVLTVPAIVTTLAFALTNSLSAVGHNLRAYSQANASGEIGISLGTGGTSTDATALVVCLDCDGTPTNLVEVAGTGNVQLDGVITSDGTGTSDYDGPITATGFVNDDVCDSTGSPGAAVCDKYGGRAAVAAAAQTVVITSNKAAATSRIWAERQTNDATCTGVASVEPASGSFTVRMLGAACTGNTNVAWGIE
jgi:hypothetical protein